MSSDAAREETVPSGPLQMPLIPGTEEGRSFWRRLFAPVDIASLVLFRVLFGAILFWEVCRYFSNGWIARYFIEPSFHFTYYGFGWVHPWPGQGMYYHFGALGVLALCIMAGLAYRLSAALFFLGFTYVFLLEQARYLNHFYLVCLVSFLMIFLPAHRAFSLDALWRPSLRSRTVPAWSLWLLRAQIGLVYFFGGIAKINGDWLQGEPMRMWLADRTHLPLLGPHLTEEWAAYFFSYGGLLFDLLVTPGLLWRRSRVWVFFGGVLFNLTNAVLFSIGIFPWLMLASTAMFFPPDWPRRLWKWRRSTAGPEMGAAPMAPPSPVARWTVGVLAGSYLMFQILMPLRHFFYPGNVNWTEEGHRFSWHMKLRSKQGEARFHVTNPATQRTYIVDPRHYLSRIQAQDLPKHPDMILQFSHYLAAEKRRQGMTGAEVRAHVMTSLNGRDRQFLIDPTVNLAAQPRTLRPAKWILPLKEPLARREQGEDDRDE